MLATSVAMAVSLGSAVAQSDQEAKPKTFDCKPVPEPVMGLDFGSRYTEDSSDRSEIDEESNADINASLKPIEQYISAMSKMANAAVLEEEFRPERVNCVVDWLYGWASADALSQLETQSSKIAIPARFAGIAAAYRQVKAIGGIDETKAEVVDKWLVARIGGMITFFETDARPKESRNNLRLWAGFAAMEAGLATDTPTFVTWASDTNKLVVCETDERGAMPLEMGRGRLALHYQLHALGPMMMTAALLQESGQDGFGICDGKIAKIASFTLAALKDPSIVDEIAGKKQSFSAKKETLKSYQMAWAEPYLRYNTDEALTTFVADMRPLAHAKLGGNLTDLFAQQEAPE